MKIGRSMRGSDLPVSTQYGTQRQRGEARDALLERRARAGRDGRTGVSVERQRDVLIRHQGIYVQATLSGPQFTRATVGNRGGPGTYVTVVIGTIVITFHDVDTLRRYAAAWAGAAAHALSLAAWVAQDTVLNHYREPGVVVSAAPGDKITRRFTTNRHLLIVAGQVTWQVADRAAFTGVAQMWASLDAQAADLFGP